jgi:hypothetical protein
MCQDHDMPKDRKLTYSDRQAQAARDNKQPKKKTVPKSTNRAR